MCGQINIAGSKLKKFEKHKKDFLGDKTTVDQKINRLNIRNTKLYIKKPVYAA